MPNKKSATIKKTPKSKEPSSHEHATTLIVAAMVAGRGSISRQEASEIIDNAYDIAEAILNKFK